MVSAEGSGPPGKVASLPMTKIAIAKNCALTHKILRQKASKLIKGCRAGLCGGTPHLLIASKPLLGRCKDALILCAFGAILCQGNFVMDRLYPVGNEAQPVGWLSSLLVRLSHRLSLRATMERKPVHDFLFTHWRGQDYTK